LAEEMSESVKSDKLIAKQEEEEKEYTTYFFQRPLGFGMAALWVFMHYLTIGLIQGYYTSVQYNLQSEGVSFDAQSKLSLAVYPYSFKFIFSPLLDRYFVRNFGRSKTYIITGGSVIGFVFLFLGPTIQKLILEMQVNELTVLFFVINLMVCIVQIAGEAWILTMFNKETKTKAAAFLNAGQSLGSILGYNVFTPLNDVEWLNSNIFVNNPRTSPLITHQMFCFFVSILYLSQIAVNLLFIAEEKMNKKNKDICKILVIFPRHFTNSRMRSLIGYMFASRFIYYMVDQSFDLVLVKNGYLDISRSTLSSIDTLTFPLVFVLTLLVMYLLKKGQLLWMTHLNVIVVVMNGFFRYFNYMNLTKNRMYNTTVAGRVFSSVITGMDFTTLFWMSFFNTIVKKEVGNTGITCLIALMNQTSVLATTIGFLLVSWQGFEAVALICVSTQLVILLLTLKIPRDFDKEDTEHFDLTKPEGAVVSKDTVVSNEYQSMKVDREREQQH